MDIKKKILLSSVAALATMSFTACGGSDGGTPVVTPDETPTETPTETSTIFSGNSKEGLKTKYDAQTTKTKETVPSNITADATWTKDKVWKLSGKVLVTNGATLTIEAGTTVIGAAGTGASASWLAIDAGSKIMAEGTADEHIVFTSETAYDGGNAEVGQWGSLVIVGNAAMDDQVGAYEVDNTLVPGTNVANDNSGVLKYIDILNSGITIETDKELNGLSLVGVGSGTTIENIVVDKSDDDCIELWGGTVNLKDIVVSECTDDQFDIDDGYSGTVTNLRIKQTTGNAAMEMSGNTAATFNNLYIDVLASVKEGGIYFKGDGIGGHFNNVYLNYPSDVSENGYGAIHSGGDADASAISFDNVIVSSDGTKFTGTDALGEIKTAYDAQTAKTKETVPSNITADATWTKDKVWKLSGKVLVTNGATLTIEAGTTVIGAAGTGASASWLAIDAGSKIMAEGTADEHIVFTSETAYDGGDPAYGQWGSLVIVGNAAMDDQVGAYEVDNTLVPGTNVANDNSGVLTYVDILNSGITIETDKELNGLSLVGVGSGTTIENIVVDKSDDDCIELWGGTVNLKDVSVSECTDDQFDIDDGYSGTVTGLMIKQTTGNAAMEMSGNTAATFNNLYIDVLTSAKEGGLYFKGDGIGGSFNNAYIQYPSTIDNGYAPIHSSGAFDSANTSFSNTYVAGSTTVEVE